MADQPGHDLPDVPYIPEPRTVRSRWDFYREQIRIVRTALAPDVQLLAVGGEIGTATLAEWRDALAAALAAPRLRLVICDCTELRFLSIGGFLALVDAQHVAFGRGIQIRVVHPPRSMIRLLTVIQQDPSLRAETYLVSAAAALAIPGRGTEQQERRTTMSANDKIDEATGKVKEVAGKATGDEELEAEGRTQHGVAKAKDAVKDAADKVGEAAKKAVGKDD